MKSMLSGSALACTALVASSLILSARPLSAEPVLYNNQAQTQKAVPISTGESEGASTVEEKHGYMGKLSANPTAETPVAGPTAYVATAYSLRGRTASGRFVSKGLVAADPRVLPLGSRVRVEAGAYSGEYLVADTGTLIKGKRIDIWIPTSREAMRFGRRTVKLTVLSYGGKRKATVKKDSSTASAKATLNNSTTK
jgi:3D (Asp-Asp-Asp) domain-containing protein